MTNRDHKLNEKDNYGKAILLDAQGGEESQLNPLNASYQDSCRDPLFADSFLIDGRCPPGLGNGGFDESLVLGGVGGVFN